MAELTQEFKILPSHEHIEALLDDAAKEIVIDVQEKVLEQIEENKGEAEVVKYVPQKLLLRVKDMFEKWVALYGYKCKIWLPSGSIDRYRFVVYSPVLTKSTKDISSKNACPTCKKRKYFYLSIFASILFGSSAAILLGVNVFKAYQDIGIVGILIGIFFMFACFGMFGGFTGLFLKCRFLMKLEHER